MLLLVMRKRAGLALGMLTIPFGLLFFPWTTWLAFRAYTSLNDSETKEYLREIR
jgi:hypothetical protein